MIQLYHKFTLRRTREGLQILKESGQEFEIVKYLEETPTKRKPERDPQKIW